MSKVTETNKNSEHDIILDYKELNKEESLNKAKAYITEKTKLVNGWTYKIK